MKKAVVLLSGGLDSTVNTYLAHQEFEVVQVLTFNYGQRAASKEIKTAKKLCHQLGLKNTVIDIQWLAGVSKSSLTDKSKSIPQGDEVKIDDLDQSQKTAQSVWVPNRNGVFLNIAASYAEALEAEVVVPGFNLEEAATFPDNSEGYMQALNQSFSFSTKNKTQVFCFTVDKNKTEIMQLAKELKISVKEIWPCYFSNETICGECESCERFIRAAREAGVVNEI